MSADPQSPVSLPPPAGAGVDLLIVAGEHSGDEHAARMVRALLARRPELRICALGGPELAGAGAQLLHDLTASSVVGLFEVLKNLGCFRALFGATLAWIETHRPRAVCFVDYPGFNLRLARALHARGLTRQGGGQIRALYYISPQIWAWKAGRRFEMARHLDAMAVIFPFEVRSYADTTVPVEFVGHPFVADDYRPPVRLDAAGPVLLLPGSRPQAVARIFPALLGGYARFLASHPERRAVVLHPSDAIEGALAGIPGAIAYRANPLTYLVGRRLVRVPYLGIANLLLPEPMYPEYLQGAATAANLASELAAAIDDPARRARSAAQAAELRALLHQPASGTAADWLERQLGAGGAGAA